MSKRQVVEIPPIETVYIEYRQFGCTCPNCLYEQKADYPPGVNAPVQYGASVLTLISYFNVFQYVPFRRLKQLFQDIFNLPLSEGSIDNGLKRAAATVGSDRWVAQLKTASKNKQLCLPHLQRDLVWLAENEQSAWAAYFIKLLQDALDLRKLAEQQGRPLRQGESAHAYQLEHRLNRLLARPIAKEQFPETQSLRL